jgi:hypothetical protein
MNKTKTRLLGLAGLVILFGGIWYALPFLIGLAQNLLSLTIFFVILAAFLYLIFILFRMLFLGR